MVSRSARVGGRSVSALLVALSMALVAVLPFAGSTMAQEEAEPSALAGLELQSIQVRATDASYAVVVAPPVVEGWTLVTLSNETEMPAVVNFAQIPEGVEAGEISSTVFSSFQGDGGELPAWWTDANFSGGAWASPGESVESAVYLTPGRWVAFSTNPMSPQPVQTFQVATEQELIDVYGFPEPEATPIATPEATPVVAEGLAADGTVTIEDGSFGGTEAAASGAQVWEVTNNSSQVAELVVAFVDYDIPPDEAVLWVGTFAAGGVGNAVVQNGSGAISPGATAYIALDLAPGTYVLFSSHPDAAGGLQSANGLTQVIQVP